MIKKIFTLLFALTLLAPSSSFGQRGVIDTNACFIVTGANVDFCCSSRNGNYDKNIQSCTEYAQSPQAQCLIVDDTNYSTCCGGNQRTISRQCNDYLTGSSGTQGTLGSGGTPNTNAQNGGPGTGGTIAPTPQANAAALKSCSAIRFDSLLDILIWLKCIIGAAIIPLIFTIAFILFLRGVLKFMQSSDNKEKKEDSKRLMWYGVIGLVVMVSVWGIVNIVNNTFGFGNTVPQLQSDCLTTDKNNPCRK